MSYLKHQLDNIETDAMTLSVQFSDSMDGSTKWLNISQEQFRRMKRILLEDELREEREARVSKIRRSLRRVT